MVWWRIGEILARTTVLCLLTAAPSACGGAPAGRCADATLRSAAVAPTSEVANGTPATAAATEDAAATGSLPAFVRAYAQAPRRTAPNGQATVAILARGHSAFVARLEMAPGATVPEHRDAAEEYVHVLSGHGVIVIDGVAQDVGPGSTIFMPADVVVSYRNGDEPMIALQVFAGPGPAAKYDGWSPATPETATPETATPETAAPATATPGAAPVP